MPFLMLFIVIPVVEMWVLIKVGSYIGALPTIALVLLTAMVGLALLRAQGISTLTRLQQKMQTGEMPAQEMVEGIFLAVGGALLLTPGFVTDGFGFACLLPGIRQILIGRLVKHVLANVQIRGFYQGNSRSGFGAGGDEGDVIDGEFRRENDRSEDDQHKLR